MEKQYFKLFSIELFLIVFSLFQFIFLEQYNGYLYIFELIAIYAVLRMLFRVDKRESFNIKSEILIIFIMCLGYYAITYFFGFFIGFVYSTYSRRLLGILRNVFFSTLFIIVLEYFRELIIQKVRYYKSLVFLSVVVFTILELLLSITLVQFGSRKAALEIIMIVVTPCVFRNVFLTYSTYYFGKTGSIIYHLLMVDVAYIVPVFPNINDYLNVIMYIIHPLLTIYLTTDLIFHKKEKDKTFKEAIIKEKRNKIILGFCSFVLIVLIYLVSDIGRFTLLAIGSESMTGAINKGDVILLDKKEQNYKVGDIIAYEFNGTLIIHRIVEINKDDKLYYKTKGDANNSEDSWEVYPEMIKGKSTLRIKYIGIPTVQLSEFLKG